MKYPTTDKVIQSFKNTFATHSVPSPIRTYIVPQFVRGECREFLKEYGIFHRKTAPLWPQANREIERQNASLLNRHKRVQVEKRNWNYALPTYLMMYRTELTVTGAVPEYLSYVNMYRKP